METDERKKVEKNKGGNYQSLPTIHVDNYLAEGLRRSKNEQLLRHMLVKYLKNHRDAVFADYKEISEVLKDEYKLDKLYTKGAISKAVRALRGDLVFKDGVYSFVKVNGSYGLRRRGERDDPLWEKLFAMPSAFSKESIHAIGDNTFVFAVNPAKSAKIKEIFSVLLGPSLCFGVLDCGDHLVIMIDREHPQAKETKRLLLNFFVNKGRYEERVMQEAEKKARQKQQDAEIKALQKKHKNHNTTTHKVLI